MNGMEAGHSDIDVSIVIVNYRVKYFLEQTVRSAKEALAGFSGEIIVVDNNSGDDSIEHLRKCFPDVIVIENRENAGFGRANNQGFAIARGKFTLILNPDTIIGSHTLRDCMDFYDKHADDCGGIGVCMLDGNGRFLPESKRAFPTPWVSFCKIFGCLPNIICAICLTTVRIVSTSSAVRLFSYAPICCAALADLMRISLCMARI